MIRDLNSKDIDIIMDIWIKSTIKAHDFIDKEYWQNNYDTVKNVYIPMSDTFLYEDEEGIKGFVSIINNEFIGALFVDINFQGNGIGKDLINYVMNKYKDLKLAVYKENKIALGFYTNVGFKIVQEQINDDSGYSEYIMQKSLNNS